MSPIVFAMYEDTILCRVSTSLIANNAVEALTHGGYDAAYSTWLDLKNIQVEARMTAYDYSLSYAGEDGWRILPQSLIIPFATELRNTKTKFTHKMAEINSAIDVIAVDKPTNAANMRKLIAGNTLQYKFRGHYDHRFAALPEKLGEALRHSMLDEQQAIAKAAIYDALARFTPPLEHLIDRLGKLIERNNALAEGRVVGRSGVLRDTAVSNLQTLVARAEGFNFANDPVLAAARDKLLPLVGNTAEDIRGASNDTLSDYRELALSAYTYLSEALAATPAGTDLAA